MRRGLAAGIGRWSARHRLLAISGWIALVALAIGAGSQLGTNELTVIEAGVGDSRTADRALASAGFLDRDTEAVLVQGRDGSSPARITAAARDVVAGVTGLAGVVEVRAGSDGAGTLSADGRSRIVEADIAPGASVAPLSAAVDEVRRDHPDLVVDQLGELSAEETIDDLISADFQRAEILSLPVTLLVLLVAFGSLVAAGVPLLLGLSAVAAALGLGAVASHVWPLDDATGSVVLLVGLAVGVDYSLFYLQRAREERQAGRSAAEALDIAAATSGRAVIVSGLTVIVAMSGMLLAGLGTFTSIAIGTMIVVAVAVVGSVTVLPAVMATLGTRIDAGRIPVLSRRRARTGPSRAMSRFIDLALARPLVSTLLAGGLLVALAAPASGLRTSLPGIESLPSSVPLSQTFDRFQAAFPGEASPATIAVQADDVRAPGVRAAISDLRREAVATGVLFEPIRVDESADGRVARILVPHAGSGTDDASRAAVRRLRESVVPATLGRVPDVRAHVGGTTAEIEDFGARLDSRSPVVFAFVLGLAFLLLLITFRSLVVAAKAVVLNLLSVAAAYGVLVLVFQRGWGASLIGLEGTVDIAGWLPLFLFVILFGLSMDYHVFVLSRIREAVDGGLGTRDAVREGLTRTAGVVTSAAVVMVSVFAIFATLTTVDMKQAGVGLAAAILIDATIVRAVLLPATMCLLGRWNWYLPPWLRWLPSTEAMRTPETQADPFDRGARLPV